MPARPVKFLLRGGTPTQIRAVGQDLGGVSETVTTLTIMRFSAATGKLFFVPSPPPERR
jgi:hypothetical protein